MPVHLPPHFEQTDTAQIAALIAAFPLATIVSTGTDGLTANHIPMQIDTEISDHGVLRGHVARHNDVWRMADTTTESLAIFQAANAYISPNWYPSKQESPRVVPTWDYAVVHCYGKLVFHDDEKWLRGVIGKLTRSMEAEQPKPWHMGQAPHDYLATQLGAIVGVEMRIGRIIAKWKMSQNRPDIDKDGAIAGLRDSGGENRAWIAGAISRNR